MERCRGVRRELTAWIDDELSERRHARVADHVAKCATCAAEAESLRAAVVFHQSALPRVTAARSDLEALRAQLRRKLATEADEPGWARASLWRWLLRPLPVAGMALAGAVALVLWLSGPEDVLVPLGVTSPPAPVARQPELFKEYQLIEQLDALEYFDTVESVPLDDEQAPQRG